MGGGRGSNALIDGLTAGEIKERKSNSSLQQSAGNALLEDDGLKENKNGEKEKGEAWGGKNTEARSSMRAGS